MTQETHFSHYSKPSLIRPLIAITIVSAIFLALLIIFLDMIDLIGWGG